MVRLQDLLAKNARSIGRGGSTTPQWRIKSVASGCLDTHSRHAEIDKLEGSQKNFRTGDGVPVAGKVNPSDFRLLLNPLNRCDSL
jgi:hypothetical protein